MAAHLMTFLCPSGQVRHSRIKFSFASVHSRSSDPCLLKCTSFCGLLGSPVSSSRLALLPRPLFSPAVLVFSQTRFLTGPCFCFFPSAPRGLLLLLCICCFPCSPALFRCRSGSSARAGFGVSTR